MTCPKLVSLASSSRRNQHDMQQKIGTTSYFGIVLIGWIVTTDNLLKNCTNPDTERKNFPALSYVKATVNCRGTRIHCMRGTHWECRHSTSTHAGYTRVCTVTPRDKKLHVTRGKHVLGWMTECRCAWANCEDNTTRYIIFCLFSHTLFTLTC